MTEENFRKYIIYLLTGFLISFIAIGYRFAENHRYVHYEHLKDHVVFGNSMKHKTPSVLDTRTGKVKSIEK